MFGPTTAPSSTARPRKVPRPPSSLTEVNPAWSAARASLVARIEESCGLVVKASGMLAV